MQNADFNAMLSSAFADYQAHLEEGVKSYAMLYREGVGWSAVALDALKQKEITPTDPDILLKKLIQEVDIGRDIKKISLLFKEAQPDLVKELEDFHLLMTYLNDGMDISQQIQNLSIKSDTLKIQLAQLSAKQFSKETCANFENFGIEDEQARIDLAKFLATHNAWAFCENFDEFGIDPDNQAAIIEIAEFAAFNGGREFAEHFEDFGIEEDNQEARVRLAKIAAQYAGDALSGYIQNFGLESEDDRIALAKLCAQSELNNVADCIELYNISNREALEEIAFIAAPNGEDFSQVVDEFGIDEQKTRINLAKLRAQTDGKEVAEHLDYYNIQDEKARLAICLITLDQHPDTLDNFKIKEMGIFQQYLDKLEAETHLQDAHIPLFDHVEKQLTEKIPPTFRSLFHKLPKDVLAQKHIQGWGLRLLSECLLGTLTCEQMHRYAPLIQELCDVRDPTMRKKLTDFFTHTFLPKSIELKSESGKMIPHMLLSTLAPELSIPDLPTKAQLHTLNRFLLNLQHTSSLTNEDKTHLISVVLTPPFSPENDQGIRIATELLALGREETLKKENIPDLAAINKQLVQFLQEEVGDLGIPDFANAFMEKVVGRFRSVGALFTYLSGLKKLPQPDRQEALSLFKQYMSAVLTDSFSQLRNDPTKNPHLARLNELNPALLKEWQESYSTSAADLLDTLDSPSQEPLKSAIRALEPKERYPFIFNPPKDYEKTVKEARQNILSRKKMLGKEEFEAQISSLNFQVYAHQFLETEGPIPSASILKIANACPRDLPLKEVLNTWKAKDEAVQFLKKKKDKLREKNYTLVNSEDPCDLLLVGDEVGAGCQQTNMLPHLNKGLLGYKLNGQDRVVAIKDEEGKIVARSMIRLLLDPVEQKGVFFQEKFYCRSLDSEVLKELIHLYCQKKAKEMGIAHLQQAGGRPYPNPLVSLGGLSKFGYSDTDFGKVSSKLTLKTSAFAS